MKPGIEARVRQRAGFRCEYCQVPQFVSAPPFQIDHVIAKKHHGTDEFDNLALSCFHCNVRKGPNIAGMDLDSGELTRLFNPRGDNWRSHFRWDGFHLVGLTAIGRTTIHVLGINEAQHVSAREALFDEGAF